MQKQQLEEEKLEEKIVSFRTSNENKSPYEWAHKDDTIARDRPDPRLNRKQKKKKNLDEDEKNFSPRDFSFFRKHSAHSYYARDLFSGPWLNR